MNSTPFSSAEPSNEKCGQLAHHLGSKVFFPNSSTYLATEAAYWTLQESELSPTCIVVPSTAEDVSTAVSTIAGNERCPFAIKGAGHAPHAGAANIVSQLFGVTISKHSLHIYFQENEILCEKYPTNQTLFAQSVVDSEIVQASGITIDMTGLASVTVNGDKAIASVGAGASWLDVYLYLDTLGVAVAGGRNGAVGVGGLTLGGLSFFFFPGPSNHIDLSHLQVAFPTLHPGKDGHATTS